MIKACRYVGDRIRAACRSDSAQEKVVPINERACAMKGGNRKHVAEPQQEKIPETLGPEYNAEIVKKKG